MSPTSERLEAGEQRVVRWMFRIHAAGDPLEHVQLCADEYDALVQDDALRLNHGVITVKANGEEVIDATTDGGYHWSQQLAVPGPPAG